MNDKDIESRVAIIVGAYLKGVKTKPEDEAVIKAGVDLITNLLININDIAKRNA